MKKVITALTIAIVMFVAVQAFADMRIVLTEKGRIVSDETQMKLAEMYQLCHKFVEVNGLTEETKKNGGLVVYTIGQMDDGFWTEATGNYCELRRINGEGSIETISFYKSGKVDIQVDEVMITSHTANVIPEQNWKRATLSSTEEADLYISTLLNEEGEQNVRIPHIFDSAEKWVFQLVSAFRGDKRVAKCFKN